MVTNIRVGLVGYGLAGKVFHAPLIRACERIELTAVMTSQEVPGAVRSLDDLLARSDLVVVASPNESHFPIAKAALDAGKHVVVDKPLALNEVEADELIDVGRKAGRLLTPFHNRRWDSDFLTVRKLMPQLGEVSLFEAHWDRFRPSIKPGWREEPREGSGLLSDLAPHMIDQALLLFGMPQAIAADVFPQRGKAQVDDYFDLTLFYDRMRVRLCASTLIAKPRPRFAIHGTDGSFVKYGLDPQEPALKDGADPLAADYGIDPSDGTLTRPDGSSEAVPSERGNYLAFYEAVAAAILGAAAPPVDPTDARDGLRLISLARSSSRLGARLELRAAHSTEG